MLNKSETVGIHSSLLNWGKVLNNSSFAIWLISPYFAPTLSIINIFSISVNLSYPFILMIINILLVVLGSIASAIMNKFLNIFNVYITQK